MAQRSLSAYNRRGQGSAIGRPEWGCAGQRVIIPHSPPFFFNLLLAVYSFWARAIPDAGPGTQARFKETLHMFFEAVNVQAKQRDSGFIPDLESYIALRRDTSGKRFLFY